MMDFGRGIGGLFVFLFVAGLLAGAGLMKACGHIPWRIAIERTDDGQ